VALKVLKKMPIDRFSKELANIAWLFTIANDLDKYNIPRAEMKKRILSKSYIVYLMAAWQVYIQDTARESFAVFRPTKPEREIEEEIRKFSSPNSKNINRIIESSTGLGTISNSWEWVGMNCQLAKDTLDKMWEIRCQVAHEGYSKEYLSEEINLDYMQFLFNLGCVINNTIASAIIDTAGNESFRHTELRYENFKAVPTQYS
jgi:hypothetical protein